MIPDITAAIAADSYVRGRALISGAFLSVSSLDLDVDYDEEPAA
jgi:hypothetical protein